MGVQDLNGPGGSYGTFNLIFSNLTETVYLDPFAGTIRQVGVISLTVSTANISIQETQQIPGQFPNPPRDVSGSVTVTLAPTGGCLSFDTGPRPVTWNTASGAYTFDGHVVSLNNVEGSYLLITEGETYSGAFTYGLSGNGNPDSGFYDGNCTFNTVYTTGYPNSLRAYP